MEYKASGGIMSRLQFILLLMSAIIGFLGSQPASAQLFLGTGHDLASPAQITQGVQPGSILILGENHGLAAHRDQHLLILNQLRQQGLHVSVGLEFLNYTDQSALNQYRVGQMSDEQFLKAVNWGGFSFEFYKPQLTFPDLAQGEFSLGLNLPRVVTSQISKNGLAALSEADRQLLPPQFELGRESYKQRFAQAAGAHCPSLDNCFAAQSAWDDTMAWQATEFIRQHPDQVLVIVVGEFHVQYGGGLPYRIHQRMPQAAVRTVSQIWADGWTDEDIQQEIQPSPLEGPRADFIWVSKPEVPAAP